MKVCETLWRKLLTHLEQEGLLAIHSVALTPADIARQVAESTGDTRVHRFVWAYYYPRSYGNEKGAMSDKQARALVASLARPPLAKDLAAVEDSGIPALRPVSLRARLCTICGLRRPMKEPA